MNTSKTILLVVSVIVISGLLVLILLILQHRTYRRSLGYRTPSKETVDLAIREKYVDNENSQPGSTIPKNIYMLRDVISKIPVDTMSAIKENFKGYNIYIYSSNKCHNFIYDYFGADMCQFFREMKSTQLRN